MWRVLVYGLKLTAYSNKDLLHVGRWSQPHYCTARLMLSLMKSQNSECTLCFWKTLNVCESKGYHVDLSSGTSYSLVYHLDDYCFFKKKKIIENIFQQSIFILLKIYLFSHMVSPPTTPSRYCTTPHPPNSNLFFFSLFEKL